MKWSAPEIARAFGATRQTLAGWLKQGGDVPTEQDVLENDELQHFVKKKSDTPALDRTSDAHDGKVRD